MPTFDNGWICKECWCANREQDNRCYRCHIARPEYAVLDEAPVMAAPSEHKLAAEPAGPPAGIIKRLTGGAEQPPAAPPVGRFCLTCGRKLLDGAAFCTQCGTPSDRGEEAPDPHLVEEGHAAEPAAAVTSPSDANRRVVGLPHVDPRAALNRLRFGYLGYIARHTRRWEITMAALSVIFVALGFAAERLAGGVGEILLVGQWALTFLFVAEYGTRLAAFPDRRSFLLGHLLELVALAPQLRAVRVLVLLPWGEIAAFARRMNARLMALRAQARSSARYWLIAVWLIMVLASVVGLYRFTGASPTAADRLLAVAAVAVIVCMVSATTAVLATSLMHERRAGLDDLAERMRVLGELKEAGLLTVEEFGAQRASMLRELSAQADPAVAGHQQQQIDSTRPISGLSPQGR